MPTIENGQLNEVFCFVSRKHTKEHSKLSFNKETWRVKCDAFRATTQQ